MEPLLATSEPAGTLLGTLGRNLGTCRNLTWNPYSKPWNSLAEPLLGTLTALTRNLGTLLGTLARNLGTFAWNLETCRSLTWNLCSEPRNLCLEPRNLPEPYYTWSRNPCSEPRNLPEPLLGTLIYSKPRNLPQPLLGTHTRNLGTLLGTLTRNLGTFTWNLCLEPRNLPEPYLEPLLGTSEPLLGSFAWNLGTCCNLTGNPCSEPRNLPEPLLGTLLGTSEPAGTRRDDCPKVPQGLVWLGPQSFQLLGKKVDRQTDLFLRFLRLSLWATLETSETSTWSGPSAVAVMSSNSPTVLIPFRKSERDNQIEALFCHLEKGT